LEELLFSKTADLASPILMQHCAMGKTIPKAKLEFMRADGQGNPIKYFEIELENVLIGSISPGIAAGTLLNEQVSLKFSKVKWRYTQQKVGGGSGGSTVGGWDLAANRITV
jgi:type VI secretion system secreted protein Hcp